MAGSNPIGYKRIIVLTIIATSAGIAADYVGLIDWIVQWL